MVDFNVKTREDSLVNVVNLHGYLDAHTAPELEIVFTRFIKDNRFRVVVNFEKLAYISSAGLGVFMAYIETMRDNSGDIKFSNMTPQVFNIFDLLGFPLLYEFYNDEEEAIKKFSEKS
ncbi:MAG: STAS domain-containing protein [Ignavibacteria bacterium]